MDVNWSERAEFAGLERGVMRDEHGWHVTGCEDCGHDAFATRREARACAERCIAAEALSIAEGMASTARELTQGLDRLRGERNDEFCVHREVIDLFRTRYWTNRSTVMRVREYPWSLVTYHDSRPTREGPIVVLRRLWAQRSDWLDAEIARIRHEIDWRDARAAQLREIAQ